MMAALSFICA